MRLGWILVAAGGIGVYLLAKNYTATHTTNGLPADATPVQAVNVAGFSGQVYLSASGYYFQYLNPYTNKQQTLGPYSQAQVAALLQAKTSLSNLLGAA